MILGGSASQGVEVLASGGGGADRFVLADPPLHGMLTIADFTPGVDRIDLGILVATSTELNPFSPVNGVRLEQRGADTVVRAPVAENGATSLRDLILIKGVVPSLLGAADFVGGYDPHGSARGLVLQGGPGADVLQGGQADDTLAGGGGDDTLWGYGGNDRLEGGAGDDTLNDGHGVIAANGLGYVGTDDVLDGGAGRDLLRSVGGNDVLRGGDGDDSLWFDHGYGSAPGSVLRMHGDAGDDHLTGGSNEYVSLELEGGAGSDTFALGMAWQGAQTILDFQAGSGGDRLDLGAAAMLLDPAPFASGQVRLEQRGADTVVLLDPDASHELGHRPLVTQECRPD